MLSDESDRAIDRWLESERLTLLRSELGQRGVAGLLRCGPLRLLLAMADT